MRTATLAVVFTTPYALMAKSSHSSEALEYILREGDIIDNDSDTIVQGGDEPNENTPMARDTLRIAPSPFFDRVAAHAITALRASNTSEERIITDMLDEQQQQHVDAN